MLVYRNSQLLATIDVTAWPYYDAGGRIGVYAYSAGTSRLDNFGGGNITLPSSGEMQATSLSELFATIDMPLTSDKASQSSKLFCPPYLLSNASRIVPTSKADSISTDPCIKNKDKSKEKKTVKATSERQRPPDPEFSNKGSRHQTEAALPSPLSFATVSSPAGPAAYHNALIFNRAFDVPPTVTNPDEMVTQTIDFTYDALNRLTSATYSDGTEFHYTYDPAGNVLTYTSTIDGQTTTITYTYDAANQLLTAAQSGVTWHYTYDGNGSLLQANPGASTTSGSKRYSYSVAGFLTKVELYDGSTWQPQAEMAYDGLGNRLEMTAHAEGQSVTTRYVLDGSQVLAAIAGANSTFYLYGHGPLAELTDAWAYPLVDGSRTARQLVDASGEVVLASSYTPWGDTLSVSGSGSFLTGSFGGIMDSATGLLYLGDGQYYDPATGRFLNRNARPNQANPYVPWSGDPLGAMMAPLAVMTVVLGRRKKHGKWEITVVLLALVFTAGLSFTACTFTTNGYEITITPNSTNPQEYNVTATPITRLG